MTLKPTALIFAFLLTATLATASDFIFGDNFELDFSLLFADDFETGDTSAWSATIPINPRTPTGAAPLAVTMDAAIAGDFGLEVSINTGTAGHLVSNEPMDETVYRVEFLFDPNTLELGENEFLTVISGIQDGIGQRLRVGFFGVDTSNDPELSDIAVFADALDDMAVWRTNGLVLKPGTRQLTVELLNASAPGVNDGEFALFVDSVEVSRLVMDNAASEIDQLRLGLSSDAVAGSGSFYIDNFRSFRSLRPQ
ncbi:MAG: hypothetical protein DHS20C11_26320 [Lysobacteraceae bacterium]|nr:MAG: hypothetical protein DHS20C11_26320 [Xanthomonadaceae bacterium]